MANKKIPDFNESELWVVRSTLEERYRAPKPFELAEADVRLQPSDHQTAEVPAIYWEDGETHFVIVKTGMERYRCQFFFRVHQQYGTGIEEYDNISECVTSLLQVQADFIAKQQT